MSHIEINEDGYIEIHEILPPQRRMTLLAVTRRWWERSRYYGPDGNLRIAQPTAMPRPASLVARVLANTFYNPHREVPMSYTSIGSYDLRVAKDSILKCLAVDDDILTQFLDSEEIEARLGAASSFADIVAVVRAMYGQEETVGDNNVGGA